MGSSPTQPHHPYPDLNPASQGTMYSRVACSRQAQCTSRCQSVATYTMWGLSHCRAALWGAGGGEAAELLWALTRWHGAGLQRHRAPCRLQVWRAAAARDLPPPPEHMQRGIRKAINPRSRSS